LLGPDEGVQIRDLGSLNGTYVNGERIKGIHSLVPGDALQIGSVSVRIEYASDTDPGKPPPKRVSAPNNATQPMKVIPPEKFTMHEVVEPEKKWWEFWK
jgi:pSer/pThr/pTyr-binding forkhead associated (FHA) protein